MLTEHRKGEIMLQEKECSQRVQSQVIKSTEFQEYQQILAEMQRDSLADQLLNELIKYQQNPKENIVELVQLEQEIDRCPVLQRFFAIRQSLSDLVAKVIDQEHQKNGTGCFGNDGCHSCGC